MTSTTADDLAASPPAPLLTRRMGDRRWDLFLRATGAAALLGIAIVVLIPGSAPLVWLAVLGIPANSPLSPIIPAAFEPLIMDAAKYSSVWRVAAVSTVIYLYTEYLNWHLYAWVLDWHRFRSISQSRSVKASAEWFSRAPFWATVVAAFTPLPFWPARALAILTRYPLRTFMLATAVGRWPSYVLYAWLGELLQVPSVLLVGVIVGSALVVIIARLAKHKPLLAETVLDAGTDSAD